MCSKPVTILPYKTPNMVQPLTKRAVSQIRVAILLDLRIERVNLQTLSQMHLSLH